LSAVPAVSPQEDALAQRWLHWQLRNAATSQTDARRVRIAFTIIFAALGAWLGVQLLAPSVWL
jgi:hypothetical protein